MLVEIGFQICFRLKKIPKNGILPPPGSIDNPFFWGNFGVLLVNDQQNLPAIGGILVRKIHDGTNMPNSKLGSTPQKTNMTS